MPSPTTALKKSKIARGTLSPKKKGKGSKRKSFSIDAAEARSDVNEQKVMQMAYVLEWCEKNEKGSRACMTENPELRLLSRSSIDRRLSGEIVNGEKHRDKCILTDLEEKDLVDFLVESNLGRDGQNLDQITRKIKDMLLVRRAQNRRGGRAHVKISMPAARILAGGFPSLRWFTLFFARHHKVVDKRGEQVVDRARAAAASEETLEEHFEAMHGLRATLLHHGIMNPETGAIDLSRLLNRDEKPQFINYSANKGNAQPKMACGKGGVHRGAGEPRIRRNERLGSIYDSWAQYIQLLMGIIPRLCLCAP